MAPSAQLRLLQLPDKRCSSSGLLWVAAEELAPLWAHPRATTNPVVSSRELRCSQNTVHVMAVAHAADNWVAEQGALPLLPKTLPAPKVSR